MRKGEAARMAKHQNNGSCEKCAEILKRAHPDLLKWFQPTQRKLPELHCCEGARGYAKQMEYFQAGKSDAPFGKSAHNYVPIVAADLFWIIDGRASWEPRLYDERLANEIPFFIRWYGDPSVSFKKGSKIVRERGHVELRNWRQLLAQGQIALIEPTPDEGGPIGA